MKKLLHISKRDRAQLFQPMKEEFEKQGVAYQHLSIELHEYNALILLKHIKSFEPDTILVHHNREILNKQFWQWVKTHTNAYLVWWINDERFPPDKWRLEYLNIIDHYLVASYDSAQVLQDYGAKHADYLLMGIPEYKNIKQKRSIPIVFTGQNSERRFPNSIIRKETILFAKKHFKTKMQVHGIRWPSNITTYKKTSMNIYHRTQIGISIDHHYTTGCHSNRLLEIMGRGCLALSYVTNGLPEIFEHEKHLAYFYDQDDLIQKVEYYLNHPNEMRKIADAGRQYVLKNFTWRAKAHKIIELINKRNLKPFKP